MKKNDLRTDKEMYDTVQKNVLKSILWASEFSKRLTIVILIIYVVNFVLGWVYQFLYHDGTAPMAEVAASIMQIVAECYLIKSGVENVSKGVCKLLYQRWNVSENTDTFDEDSEEYEEYEEDNEDDELTE